MARPSIGGRGTLTPGEKALAVGVYTKTGNLTKAAQAAGCKRRQILGEQDGDPEFAADMHDALQSYLDGVEEGLGDLLTGRTRGNPLPGFAILKAHRPDKYHDKAQSAAVQVNITQGSPISEEAARDLFVASLRAATDITKRALTDGLSGPGALPLGAVGGGTHE